MSARHAVRSLLVAALLLGACTSAGEPPSASPSSTTTLSPTTITSTTEPVSPSTTVADPADEYRPGRAAELYLPSSGQSAPLVVMVPGGAWRSSDPSGLTGLAQSLAEAGISAMTVEVGAAEDGALYPTPLQDIQCAVGFGVSRAGQAGVEAGPVVLLGHSSGAHLAALAALDPPDEIPGCEYPPVPVDALIGLAGVYDVDRLPSLAYLLFGVTPEADPELWEEGNPLLRADLRPDLPALLLHGGADSLVPVSFTEDFAAALEEGGHDTTVSLLPDADHGNIFTAEVSGELITDWILRLGS